jgi:hypothetical protein
MQVELEQRIIIKFLTKENMDAHEILAKLQAHFENEAYALRTVRLRMGEAHRGREDLRDEHRSGRLPLTPINTQLMHILGKSSFESARSIGQTLKTSHRFGLHHLYEVVGFKSFHLR